MEKSWLFPALRYLPFIGAIFCLFFIPYFYHQRMATGIFKTDFHLVWITGCLCWLHVVSIQTISGQFAKICFIGCIYVLFLCFFKSSWDENSIYAFLTLVCSIGIVRHLQTISSSKLFLIIVATIIVSFSIQLYIGYVQAIRNHWRGLAISGSFYNSGFFANYLASIIPLLLGGFLNRSFIMHLRIIFLIAFLSGLALLTMTLARAAIIGTVLGSLFVVLSYHQKIKIKWFFAFAFILLIPFITVLYKLKPESALGRLTIYRVVTNIIKDHPLAGIGPNRFAAVYNNYQSEFFKEERSSIQIQLLAANTFEAFNSVIQILVEYGLIGLLLLGMATHFLLRKINAPSSPEKKWMFWGSCGCVISIVASSMFSNPFHVTPILLIFCFHLSVILSQTTPLGSRKRNIFQLITAAAFAILVAAYFFIQYRSKKNWKLASDTAVYDNFERAERFYQAAYPFLKFNGDFLYNYGAEACLAGDYDLAIKLLTQAARYNSFSDLFVYLADAHAATGQYELAEKNYLHAIYMVPSHVFPKFQLIQLYKKWRKPDQARSWTIKTLNYPIKVRSEFVQQLIRELKKDI